MNTIRIKFQKVGLASFFSHLDLQKIMMRAVKKSGLPVWYSMGYNPHIYMTFTLPLSLGHESICESFDFRLTEELSEKEIIEAMKNTLPEGIIITGASTPEYDVSEIKYAEYHITMYGDKEVLNKAMNAYEDSSEVIVTKTTKRSSKEINLKNEIINMNIIGEDDESISFSALYPAGNTYNLNPALLLEYFRTNYGIDINGADVLRVHLLNENLEILQ